MTTNRRVAEIALRNHDNIDDDVINNYRLKLDWL
jgi:hypothetical protein